MPRFTLPRLKRIRSYAILKSRRFVFWLRGKIGNVIEVVDLSSQINLEVDSYDVQELLDSNNQELTMDELIEIYEQDIEELL
ncbi:hypothetical protein TNCV_2696301 [Trichonephila clavipes]|nr:hypothetical protein TNCV_2696301 [Trichonephila clavipes]